MSITSLSILTDTQYNETQLTNTQHNDIHHFNIQYNDPIRKTRFGIITLSIITFSITRLRITQLNSIQRVAHGITQVLYLSDVAP